MKAVKITELDSVSKFPVTFILKSHTLEEIAGCCPKSFLNFFGLLGLIEGLNSEFLLWLKTELRENDATLITPPDGLRDFLKNPIFEKLDCAGGLVEGVGFYEILGSLHQGFVLFTVLFNKGADKVSHCVVIHIQDQKLFADGVEISLETFARMIFCHEKNFFILGKRKARD